MSPSLQCPNCGGPLPLSCRFVRVVTCSYCSTLNEVTSDGVQMAGTSARLTPLPTRFFVGAMGELAGERFQVLGRVRYSYDEGTWDEWYLLLSNGEPAWLEEDEGELTLSRMEPLDEVVPAFDQIRVGQQLTVQGVSFRVTERCRATVLGCEGQLFGLTRPRTPVNFIEGSGGGRIAFLEYTPDGVEFGTGRVVPRSEISVEPAR